MALVIPRNEGHRRRVMSMYTNILEAALHERPQPDAGLTTGQALAELVCIPATI